MKIYFCDGCNESIPLSDIQASQVTTIKGKLFCRECIPLGASTTPVGAAPVASSGRTSPALVVLVLLLLGWVAFREYRPATARTPSYVGTEDSLDESDTGWRIDAVEKDAVELFRKMDETTRAVDFLRGDLDQMRAAQADLDRAGEQRRHEIDRLARGQVETGKLIEQIKNVDSRADMINGRIDGIGDIITGLQEQIASLPAGGAMVPLAVGGESGDMGIDPVVLGEYAELRRLLLDADASRRFDAVSQIMDQRIKDLAPDLVETLADEDPFVKILAIEALGDFAYVEAIPTLFDVLEDPSPQIRKTAAETLVKLTGYDPGYDARGTAGDRRKAVDAWQAWLSKR